jgi:uncharacterized protein (TIGR00266 family)
MKHEISGSEMQIVTLELNSGEFVQAEAGGMFFMEGDIDIDIKVPGGWVGGLKRMFVGESFVLPVFKSKKDGSKVAFSPSYPGKVLEIDVNSSTTWQAQKNSFLCATGNVSINIAFIKKFSVGIFGGEGFVLEKFSGNGKVFVHCGGLTVEKTLAEKETIQVDTGCIVAFEQTVNYDVRSMRNIKTALFGGEGLFLSTLTGPGKVILQSLPWSRFKNEIFRGEASKGPLGDVGRVLGGD